MSTPRVINLKPDVDQDVVEALEAALRAAKTGELTGVAIVGERRDGSVSTYTSCHRGFQTIGALELLKSKVLDSLPVMPNDD